MKFIQIKPQKARGKFLESMWTDPSWSAENKFDGDRRISQFMWRGQCVQFTGTRESVDGTGYVNKSANIPHLSGYRDSVRACKALGGTVLDGEIVAPWASKLPGGESKWVTSIMGSSPQEAIRKQQEHGWLEYMVFDCLYFKGRDVRRLSLYERGDLADEALGIWRNDCAKLVRCWNKEPGKRAAWRDAREGLVFKHEDHTYGDESLWVKLKKEFTADVVCMGFEPGHGKYAGSVGAIVFGQVIPGTVTGTAAPGKVYLTKMGTCRGFTDAQMNRLSREPKKYLGRVMEITHNGREPTGAFRHPRFKWKWRDDKSPRDCVYREDET